MKHFISEIITVYAFTTVILKLKLREDGFFSLVVYIYTVMKCTTKQKTLMDGTGHNALIPNQTYPTWVFRIKMLEIIIMFAFKTYASAF